MTPIWARRPSQMRMHHAINLITLTQLHQTANYQARNAEDTILRNHHLELGDGGKEGCNQPSLEETDLSPREKLLQFVWMLIEWLRKLWTKSLTRSTTAPKGKKTVVTLYAGKLGFQSKPHGYSRNSSETFQTPHTSAWANFSQPTISTNLQVPFSRQASFSCFCDHWIIVCGEANTKN